MYIILHYHQSIAKLTSTCHQTIIKTPRLVTFGRLACLGYNVGAQKGCELTFNYEKRDKVNCVLNDESSVQRDE